MTQPWVVRIMVPEEIDRTLSRMAAEILEHDRDLSHLALVGIRTRGVDLARRLGEKVRAIEGQAPPVGVLDINVLLSPHFNKF